MAREPTKNPAVGNSGHSGHDYMGMHCQDAREAISALLDDEPCPFDPVAVDDHLTCCSACRRWKEAAHELTRRGRLRPVAASMAPDPSFVASLPLAEAAPSWWRTARAVRLGLVVVALLQFAVTTPLLFLGHLDATRDIGAFDLALAVGFVIAASRPLRAAGMTAIVGTASVTLVSMAIISIIQGRTTIERELPHMVALVGWLLLHRLARLVPTTVDRSSLAWGERLRDVVARAARVRLVVVAAGSPRRGVPGAQSAGPPGGRAATWRHARRRTAA